MTFTLLLRLSFNTLFGPVEATVGSALDGRDGVDGLSSQRQHELAESERELRELLRQADDLSPAQQQQLVRVGARTVAVLCLFVVEVSGYF